MTQRTKRDWLLEGLNILAEAGVNELTIDELTRRLGVTKGSFYHHFKNYQNFKESLLSFVEEEGTLQTIELTEQAETPEEKIEHLIKVTSSGPSRVEVVIRAWALQDDLVRTYQQRIDQRRLSYLRDIFYALTHNEIQALYMAQLLYTVYIGSQHVIPPIQEEALAQLYQQLKPLFGLS